MYKIKKSCSARQSKTNRTWLTYTMLPLLRPRGMKMLIGGLWLLFIKIRWLGRFSGGSDDIYMPPRRNGKSPRRSSKCCNITTRVYIIFKCHGVSESLPPSLWHIQHNNLRKGKRNTRITSTVCYCEVKTTEDAVLACSGEPQKHTRVHVLTQSADWCSVL
jgi:hypothetical protein